MPPVSTALQQTQFEREREKMQQHHGQLWSETEILIQEINASGKAWHTEADKSWYDNTTMQNYMRHIAQQSHGYKTYALAAAIHLTTFKTRASLMGIGKRS